VLLSQGYVAWQIPGLLEGLDYEWDGRTILPDDRIADWIVQSASTFWEEHGEPVVPGLATSLR
jgi:hypothetical protein